MSDNTPDGAEGLFRPQLQAALAVAGRLGEMLARQRAERYEELKRAKDAQRRQLEERFEAERAVMRTQLTAVHQPQFWESAKPADIGALYGTARQWERFDEMARASREHMQDEIRTRYDLTPEEYLDKHGLSTNQGEADSDVEKTPDDREVVPEDEKTPDDREVVPDDVNLGAVNEPRDREKGDERDTEYPIPEWSVETDWTSDGDSTDEEESAKEERDAERDYAEAAQQSAVVAAGDLKNDADTQNAAATADALWDSGDRRSKLADTLMERVGTTDIGRQGVDAVLGADLSNGTPPSAAVRRVRRFLKRGKGVVVEQSVSKDFGRE